MYVLKQGHSCRHFSDSLTERKMPTMPKCSILCGVNPKKKYAQNCQNPHSFMLLNISPWVLNTELFTLGSVQVVILGSKVVHDKAILF